MDLRDLQRETYYTERIAELGRIVLNANQQLNVQRAEIDRLTAENEQLKVAQQPIGDSHDH